MTTQEQIKESPGQSSEVTDEQAIEAMKFLAASGAAPTAEDKYNVHLFLHRVATEDDTTKVGNLNEIELGKPQSPLRDLKELALISSDIVGNESFSEYFAKEAEILSSTSLSKDGFLVRQATTTTRQIADVTKKGSKKENSGWFKKKDTNNGGEQSQS